MQPSGFEFSLQRLAMFSVGRTIWQRPAVSAEMTSWFDRWFIWPDTPTSDWHKFIRRLLDDIREQTSLPQHLESELSNVVKEMGIQLLDLLEHVKHANEEYYRRLSLTYWETIDCPVNVHWTSRGTIDVSKSIEDSYVRNPRPKQLCATYHMAVCAGIREEIVHDLWSSMTETQRFMYRGICNEEYAVHSYYECHRERDLRQLKEEIAANRGSFRLNVTYDRRFSFDENLLLIFVSEGHAEAAKLFWTRLDELARERVVEDAAAIALDRWTRPVRNYTDFMARQWAELSIFLTSKLTVEQKKTMLVGKASVVLRLIAMTWPWRDFFFQVFDELWEYFGNDGRNYDVVLYDMAERLVSEDAKTGYVVEGSKNQQLLQKYWRRLPAEVKVQCHAKLTMAVHKLVEVRDMSSVTMLLNSPEVAFKKAQILDFSKALFEDMVANNELAILEKFIQGNFKAEREKNAFKQSLLPHATFILKGRLDLSEKFLNWQCKTEREKVLVKMAIDHREIGRSSCTYKRKKIFRNFLNWQCQSLEMRRNWENLNCKFDQNIIYKLWIRWKSKVRKGEKKADEFFEWFLKLEEEIKEYLFRRTANDEFVASLVEAIVKQNYFDIVDNLKRWCAMTDEEVQRVRRKILSASKIPICRHCIEAGEIHASRAFLRWIEDEKERANFVNHFVSHKGSTSCYLFIANDRSLLTKKKSLFRNFIDTWVSPLGDAQLRQFKKGVSFQAKISKYKQPEDWKNYEIFQSLLNEIL